jgi:Tol biopolymer transport system component
MNGRGATGSWRGKAPAANARLDSWKEIAAYLKRDERTVRRWEKDGLPVHRHRHKLRAAVFAYTTELDAWWTQDRAAVEDRKPLELVLPQPARTRPRWPLLVAGVVVVAALVLLIAWVVVSNRTVSDAPAMSVMPFTSDEGVSAYPAFSPDGKALAFTLATSEFPNSQIFVKLIGGESSLRLTSNTDGDNLSPSWSPDGTRIAFLRTSATDTGIFVVPALGGHERKLLSLSADRYYTLDWSPDGRYIAFARRQSADDPYCIYLLSPEDGQQRQLTSSPAKHTGDTRFAFSPDSKTVAFIHYGAGGRFLIELVSIEAGSAPRIVASYEEWIGGLAWSADGDSLIITGNRQGVRKLWRLRIKDAREELLAGVGDDAFSPAVSRQGHRLAFVHDVQNSDLWRSHLSSPQGPGAPPEHVVSSTRVEGAPRFSRDGSRIAYQSYRTGTPEIWVSDPDGSNAVQLTFLHTAKPDSPTWSADDRTIAFGDGGKFQLVSAKGGPPQQISQSVDYFGGPSWSRDGRFLYFWKPGTGGEMQIWKVSCDGGRPVQITQNGGFSSMESPDGKFLYYTKQKTSGIWKVPAEGGRETLVLDRAAASLPGYWEVVSDGIFYLDASVGPDGMISFYSFAKRQSTPVVDMGAAGDEWFGGLTVSPDREWIVFSRHEYSSSEIMLVENFR